MQMKNYIIITCIAIAATAFSQQVHRSKTGRLAVDDRSEGYAICKYRIPQDGFYSFSINGGLFPKKNSTIYYFEYLLELSAGTKCYVQDTPNIASQAQDGDVCYFHTNEKNNTVNGVFKKNDEVELRLLLYKSEVNGIPHGKLNTTANTLVSVKQLTPVYCSN
jgi:hypothetical protein